MSGRSEFAADRFAEALVIEAIEPVMVRRDCDGFRDLGFLALSGPEHTLKIGTVGGTEAEAYASFKTACMAWAALRRLP